ncbi:uncharacterized protein G2W53_033783 [Senna tora]|uniref:Uncharacterized protein n=1 Tax=Senna tora TaxID=362788 RepID=A0A834T2V7_9FABA|nr:uncharacterized protein G2W53_033783 [Senna tora]
MRQLKGAQAVDSIDVATARKFWATTKTHRGCNPDLKKCPGCIPQKMGYNQL